MIHRLNDLVRDVLLTHTLANTTTCFFCLPCILSGPLFFLSLFPASSVSHTFIISLAAISLPLP